MFSRFAHRSSAPLPTILRIVALAMSAPSECNSAASPNFELPANVENGIVIGRGNVTLEGNAAANNLTGGIGNNTLDGGDGKDTLTGGAGRDSFLFDSALTAANLDRVTDFKAIDDTVRLDDAVFGTLANGVLPSGAFFTGPAAHDASDRIIYNKSTGALLYDADGQGGVAAVQFATLAPGLTLTQADFVVV
jgi:serralysin